MPIHLTRILMTDGRCKHTLGAVRSLARAGFHVDVVGSRHCLSSWSRYLSQIAYPQSRFTKDHIDDFIRFLASSHYEVLLPVGARSVKLVSDSRHDIGRYCAVPLPSPEAIELCLSKDATYRFAAGMGVKVPQTWVFTGIEDLKKHIIGLVFPVVVKDRNEITENPPFYARNAEQLLAAANGWGRDLSSEDMPFPLIQQYIKGPGIGFFALYQGGQCKRVFMHRRIRETPPSGGASCCAVSIYEEDVLATGRRLLDALAWHGVAMVEFKRQEDSGDLYLMEVNPKFWGSLDLALASGVDFPSLDVRTALGEEIPYSEDYRIGLKLHWPLHGEMTHIGQNLKATLAVLTDSLDPRVKSNLHIDDPVPVLYSLSVEIRRLIRWMLTKVALGRLLQRIRRQGLRTAIVRTYCEGTGIPLLKYCQVTPQVYIGAQHGWTGKQKLRRWGISAIVNMRSEFDDSCHDLVLGHYCHLGTEEFTAPTIEQLQEGIAFIRRVVDGGGRVYVHCSEGVSRAPTMVTAFLIDQGMTLPEAIDHIRRSRPFINILPVQMQRLREFAGLHNSRIELEQSTASLSQ
jgi:predicted ATP-grasp superfamily ATP-dependent carboligase